jgi:CDP-glycerol glycerophosphotransferase (TagB/SpsB family)
MSLIKDLVGKILHLLPKNRRKILFESAPDLSDNARALYEFIRRQENGDTYRFVWCVSDPEKYRGNPDFSGTKFTSFREKKYLLNYLWHVATAGTVFYTHATPPMIDCEKQTVLCLWHGTPLKLMDYKATGRQPFSKLLSASGWCSEALCECFHIGMEQTVICGYPRNDQLFESAGALEKLGISPGEYAQVLLWAPTFRQSRSLGIYETEQTQTGLPLLEDPQDVLAFNKVLREKNVCCILKLHPAQDMSGVGEVALSNIRMLTNADLDARDIQFYHLLGECDALLTDYSSVYFDYLLLDRPIGFTVDDIDQYREARGFVCDDPYSMMPGEKIRTVPQLENFIAHLAAGEDTYSGERERVCRQVNQYRDGRSAERIYREFVLQGIEK